MARKLGSSRDLDNPKKSFVHFISQSKRWESQLYVFLGGKNGS